MKLNQGLIFIVDTTIIKTKKQNLIPQMTFKQCTYFIISKKITYYLLILITMVYITTKIVFF